MLQEQGSKLDCHNQFNYNQLKIMSRITITSNLQHQVTGLNSGSSQSYEANEDLITAIVETVLDTPVTTVSYGDIITPKYAQLRLISGASAEVSLDSGSTWPLRLTSPGDAILLGLNNSGSVEISTVEATSADTDGNKSGLYFDVYDKDGPVRCYFDVPERAEVSQIVATADVSGSLDGDGFIIYDSAGSVGVWFDHGDSGTAAPADVAACARTIEITGGANDDTAATIATLIQAALNGDSAFSASVLSDTVTITDAAVGTRTNIADSASSATGFTFSTPTNGIADVVTPATPGGGRLLAIPLVAGATVAQVASSIAASVGADSNFSVVSDGVDTATITDAHLGTRTDIAAGTSTYTVAKTQDGTAVQTIQVRSESTTETSRVLCSSVPV